MNWKRCWKRSKNKGEENRERLQQSFESKVNATREAVLELQAASVERLQERMETISKGLNSGAQRRLLKAFPGMKAGTRRASILHMKETVGHQRAKKMRTKVNRGQGRILGLCSAIL